MLPALVAFCWCFPRLFRGCWIRLSAPVSASSSASDFASLFRPFLMSSSFLVRSYQTSRLRILAPPGTRRLSPLRLFLFWALRCALFDCPSSAAVCPAVRGACGSQRVSSSPSPDFQMVHASFLREFFRASVSCTYEFRASLAPRRSRPIEISVNMPQSKPFSCCGQVPERSVVDHSLSQSS